MWYIISNTYCIVIARKLCFCLVFRRLDRDSVQQDKAALLRKLMEAEVDGAAAAKQVSALRESVSKLCGFGGSVSINSVSDLFMCPVI